MPTDPCYVGLGDGSESWNTIDIANDQLNNRDAGWIWVPNSTWEIDFNAPDADPRDGWSYSFDFGGKGRVKARFSAKKNTSHYVRRRRLVRPQYFSQDELDAEMIRREVMMAERAERAKAPFKAVADDFKHFGEEVANIGTTINNSIQKSVVDAVMAPVYNFRDKEVSDLMNYINNGKDSWRLFGFFGGLALLLTGLMTAFSDLLVLDVPDACLNLFLMGCGALAVCLEYRHWGTKVVVDYIRKEVRI
jgi:hypothetical protein